MSPPSQRQYKYSEVTFNFKSDTKFGQKVAIVGNLMLIGNWDPEKAVYMNTTDQSYPNWTIKIDFPRDKIIEYKYVLVTEITGKFQQTPNFKVKSPTRRSIYTWENLPGDVNRIVDTTGKKEVQLFDEMNKQESFEEYLEAPIIKRSTLRGDSDLELQN